MELRNEGNFHSFEVPKKDPPDCVILDVQERKIAVEITEFVNEQSVRDHAQGKPVDYFWYHNDVIDKINTIIKEKDSKSFFGGPYFQKWLIIHCDEPSMTYRNYLQDLSDNIFLKLNQIDLVYFLFSSDPYEGCYPYIILKSER